MPQNSNELSISASLSTDTTHEYATNFMYRFVIFLNDATTCHPPSDKFVGEVLQADNSSYTLHSKQ